MCKKYTCIVFLYSIYAGNEQDNSTWYMCYLHAVGTGPCLLYATCMHMAYMHYAHILPIRTSCAHGQILGCCTYSTYVHYVRMICTIYMQQSCKLAHMYVCHMHSAFPWGITRQYCAASWLRSTARLELVRIHYSADTRLSPFHLLTGEPRNEAREHGDLMETEQELQSY